MSVPTFTSLGINDKPIIDSFTESMPHLDPVETDFEGGNKRRRRLPGDEVFQVQFDILFTNAEYATFRTYAITTLGNGTARFQMRIWRPESLSMVERLVQFSQKWQPIPQPPKYTRVAFQLWVYP